MRSWTTIAKPTKQTPKLIGVVIVVYVIVATKHFTANSTLGLLFHPLFVEPGFDLFKRLAGLVCHFLQLFPIGIFCCLAFAIFVLMRL